MRARLITALVLLFLAGSASGPARGQNPPPAAAALTPLEQVKLELLRTRTQLAEVLTQLDATRAELGRAHESIGRLRAENATILLTREEAALKADIEAARPGYTWDPKTGAFTAKGGQ